MTRPGPGVYVNDVEIIEQHLHANQLCFGRNIATGFLQQDSLTSFQFVSGVGGAWGTEYQLYNGAYGSGYRFDCDKVLVTGIQRTGDLY